MPISNVNINHKTTSCTKQAAKNYNSTTHHQMRSSNTTVYLLFYLHDTNIPGCLKCGPEISWELSSYSRAAVGNEKVEIYTTSHNSGTTEHGRLSTGLRMCTVGNSLIHVIGSSLVKLSKVHNYKFPECKDNVYRSKRWVYKREFDLAVYNI